jgi:hypothetical protein
MNYVVAPHRDLSRQNQNTKFAAVRSQLYSAQHMSLSL